MSSVPAASTLALDAESACARARAERERVERSVQRLGEVRRELLEAGSLVETAARDADRHAIRSHKDALRRTWRETMEDAPDEDARREATAAWLRQITVTNERMRHAMRQLAQGRARVASLEAQLRAADLDAAAARIRAEVADAACAEARQRRAAEEEAAVLHDGRDRAGVVAAAGVDAAVVAMTRATLAPDALGSGPTNDGLDADPGLDEPGLADAPPPTPPAPVESITVRRLLAGDPGTHAAIAAELSEMSGKLPARYLLLLKRLVDALSEAAIDAGDLAFDHDHPLWAQFSPDEARLIVRALRDLGFRLDLDDGWFGGRAPSASDLAAAFGLVGHDVRGLRAPPSGGQLRELPRSIHVALHDHLRRTAPDLSLEQVTGALGRRATPLGELWDEWGRIRPLLLTGVPAEGVSLPV